MTATMHRRLAAAAAAAIASSLGLAAPASSAHARIPAGTRAETPLTRGLVLKLAEDVRARTGLDLDPIEAALVLGTWKRPASGSRVAFADGSAHTWRETSANDQGWFEGEDLEGGYVFVRVDSDRARVAILRAMGNDMVFVNGVPRAGNQYGLEDADEAKPSKPGFDYSLLPIPLRAGANELLFRCYRGRLKASLSDPPREVFFNAKDTTLPDLVAGDPDADASRRTAWGAIVVVNATGSPLRDAAISAFLPAAPGARPVVTSLPVLPPMSVRKVGFRLEAGTLPRGSQDLILELRRAPPDGARTGKRPAAAGTDAAPGHRGRRRKTAHGRTASEGPRSPDRSSDASGEGAGGRGDGTLASSAVTADFATLALACVGPEEPRKITFVSGIDGSVQYYALLPARERGAGALVLSLHGAAVEAINQARSYAPKGWAHIVAPTNRRPYGFNWEDWGRLDALEVLEIAKRDLAVDPARIYLTGHSMGGHGCWSLGGLASGRFAAIGPSSGWLSFWSYRARKPPDDGTPIGRILRRATSPTDTEALAVNLRGLGVYVLHGSEDDNVPVSESRRMVERLSTLHRDLVYHEQAGAGHWWDLSDEPGTDCVDWPPLFDFFARRARAPANAAREIEFMTASPGVSSSRDWASIEAQLVPLEMSTVNLRCDPFRRRFVGTTENVARLAIDLAPLVPGESLTAVLDGQTIGPIPWPKASPGSAASRLHLARGKDGAWIATSEPSASLKGPDRYGPFKEAFRNRMVFVYGTKGTRAENDWAFAKARYDAERFWYEGNGSIDLLPDVELAPDAEPDRNVILYGNAATNAAWGRLLGESPVQVDRDGVRIGSRRIAGPGLACLFLRPRPGSAIATIGAVAGSDLAGMRLTTSKLYLEAGYPFPDCIVFRAPDSDGSGVRDQDRGIVNDPRGIVAAGFFGIDWSVDSGDFAYADPGPSRRSRASGTRRTLRGSRRPRAAP